MTGPDDPTTCPFCAIARGDDGSVEIVCEDQGWVAFFPLEPATPGHTLIIPRHHVRHLWVMDSADARALMGAVVRVGAAIDEALNPEGLNLITSAGEAAEQTVFHLHLHVVPRWQRDGFKIWPPDRPFPEQLKEEAAERIRQACSLH